MLNGGPQLYDIPGTGVVTGAGATLQLLQCHRPIEIFATVVSSTSSLPGHYPHNLHMSPCSDRYTPSFGRHRDRQLCRLWARTWSLVSQMAEAVKEEQCVGS